MRGGKKPPRSTTHPPKPIPLVDSSAIENAPILLKQSVPVVDDPLAEKEAITAHSTRPLGGEPPDIFVQAALPSFISLPEDTLLRHLSDYEGSLETRSKWQVPASFLIPIAMVFVVSGSFRDFGFVKGDVVEAFIAFCAVGCLIWLCNKLTLLRKKPITKHDVIAKCRDSMPRK
jgi:hypothetical protein